VHQLEIKMLNIIDARCNHEVYWLQSSFLFPIHACYEASGSYLLARCLRSRYSRKDVTQHQASAKYYISCLLTFRCSIFLLIKYLTVSTCELFSPVQLYCEIQTQYTHFLTLWSSTEGSSLGAAVSEHTFLHFMFLAPCIVTQLYNTIIQHNYTTQLYSTIIQHNYTTLLYNSIVQHNYTTQLKHNYTTQLYNTIIQHNYTTQLYNTIIQHKQTKCKIL